MVDRRRILQSGAAAASALAAGCAEWLSGSSSTVDEDQSSSLLTTSPETTADTTDTAEDAEAVTIAFIGDQGLSDTAREVLGLIRREGADLVVHAGDFDYENDPEAWNAMLVDELGQDFPYLATIGGHDQGAWDGYEAVLRERASVDGLDYSGDLGLQATATYGDVTIVLSSVGFCQDDEETAKYPDLCERIRRYDHEQYIADQFDAADTTWRVCAWHKPTDSLNPGNKGTDTPVSVYDTCRRHGALVHTADEHAYGRTFPMDSFEQRTVASRSPPYTLGDGTTFNVLSGVGGQSFYEASEQADDPLWAATNTKGDDGSFGAFFGTFRPDGTGSCYFKDVEGDVLDGPFAIESGN